MRAGLPVFLTIVMLASIWSVSKNRCHVIVVLLAKLVATHISGKAGNDRQS